MLPRGRLPRQAKGFDAAGRWLDPTSNRHAPSRSNPLQARNPQQARAELEGVGAGAAEGEAGGAGGLGHRRLVVDSVGQGGGATVGYNHALNSDPSESGARRTLCSAVNRWFLDPLSRPAAGHPLY